jgi:hypothetical protein
MDNICVIVRLIVRFVQSLHRYTIKGLLISAAGLSVVFFVFQVVVLPPNKLLKPTGHVMHHQQFNIQQLYALPTLYLCVLYLSENKQRLLPLTA